MNLSERCRRIKLILSDVDGVLSDGGVSYDANGLESKRFHIRDGLGIKLWQKCGLKFGIVSARLSAPTTIRAAELKIDLLRQGSLAKQPAADELMREANVTPEETAFIGDDIVDVAVMKRVGLGIAVADAVDEARAAAAYVTNARGGHGAVREAIELILKAQGRWGEVVASFA